MCQENPWRQRPGCPRASTLIGTNKVTGARKFIPIRCKTWSCPYCAPINAEQLAKRITSGNPTHFITLTTRPIPGETPKQTHDRCRKQIGKLITHIRNKHGAFQCAVLLELTKKGNPHWHLLARCNFIPQRFISRTWHRLTGAWIVDIRCVEDPHEAARYVTKYVTKHAQATALAKIGRVHSFTRGYLIKEQSKSPGPNWSWKLIRSHPLNELEKLGPGFDIHYEEGTWYVLPTWQPSQPPAEEPRPPPPRMLPF